MALVVAAGCALLAVGIAPLILGGASAPSWTRDLGLGSLSDAIEVTSMDCRRVGRDVWIEASLKGPSDV